MIQNNRSIVKRRVAVRALWAAIRGVFTCATIGNKEILGMPADVRPSPIAGTWYPGSAEALSQSVDRQLDQAAVSPIPGTILAVIAPHAGHVYSGLVAAHAFRLVMGLRPDVVAVVSPLHVPYPGDVLSTAHRAYATPLGSIPVDEGLLDAFEAQLKGHGVRKLARIRDDQEHSLEIELPFLQRTLGGPFRLLPVMLRDQSAQVAQAVGRSLAATLKEREALVIASSDLSHFYPDPVARKLDAVVLGRIEAFDPAGVLAAEDEGVGFACGRGAIAAVMWAARELGADAVRVLRHATSGDVTGDFTSVVGYGAAVIYRTAQSS
jgi:AmmeMemoRadiSam system protein B